MSRKITEGSHWVADINSTAQGEELYVPGKGVVAWWNRETNITTCPIYWSWNGGYRDNTGNRLESIAYHFDEELQWNLRHPDNPHYNMH